MKNIIKSLVIIAAVGAIASGATYSEFTSQAVASGNTFSAGTLNLVMSNNGWSSYGTTVSNTWKSPANWAPGGIVEGTLEMTNTGTVNANHIYYGFNNPTNSGGQNNANLFNAIIVTNLQESFDDGTTWTDNQASTLAGQVGKGGVLTLADMVNFMPNGYGFYTVNTNPSLPVLQAGNHKDYQIKFTFEFDPNAGNDYQGAQAAFTLNVNATQNSDTTGMLQI